MQNALRTSARNIPVGTRNLKHHCDIDRKKTNLITYAHQEIHLGRVGYLVSPPLLVSGKHDGWTRPPRIKLELQLLDGLLGLRVHLPVLRRR